VPAGAFPSDEDRTRQEAGLWRSLKHEGSAGAREQLFGLYTGLARRIARHHLRHPGDHTIEYPDLCQLAYAGLLEAIDRFDPTHGVSFAHYAERRITGSVLDGLQHASELHEQLSFRQRMRRERAKSLAGEDASTLSSTEALDRLAEAAVGLALGFMLEGTDVYVPEGTPDHQANAYESVAWTELLRRVLAEIQHLPERERLIIRQHYLEGVDFDRLGALLHLSKGRISQLHRSALARLKDQLNRAGQFSLER
jgi:RNA polymerase sigma factor for flagellar operon FliA